MSEVLDLVPPQALEMEQAVLGAMMNDPSVIDLAAFIVKSDDFYREAHRIIFDAILAIRLRDEPVDLLTVEAQLRLQEVLESIGGLPYLVTLYNATATPSNVDYYAKIVADKSFLRRLEKVGKGFAALAHSEYDNIEAIEAEAENLYNGIARTTAQKGPRPMRALVNEAFEQIEDWHEKKQPIIGIETGLSELDFLLRGIQARKLYVIAARPGMGKSALAGQIAMNAAKNGHKTLIASLEMGDMEFVHRMIATKSGHDANSIASGYLSDDMWRGVGDACSRLSEYPIWIDDQSDTSADRLRLLARRFAREGMKLLIVDYLQLVKSDTDRDNRTREIDLIAHALKGIAKSLDIPVIALSQLSRKVDDRPNHRPTLGDLRESGGIEAEADVVIFPYNPAHYGDPSARMDFEPVELIVAKARGGKLGIARAGWKCRVTEFVNLTRDYEDQAVVAQKDTVAKNGTQPALNPMEAAGWNP